MALQPSGGRLQPSLQREGREEKRCGKRACVFWWHCSWVAAMVAGLGCGGKGSGILPFEFRAFSQFKSVKLTWQSKLSASTAKSFQITRSIYYQKALTPSGDGRAKECEGSCSFVDREIKSSENYYYKITVEGPGRPSVGCGQAFPLPAGDLICERCWERARWNGGLAASCSWRSFSLRDFRASLWALQLSPTSTA